MRQQLFHAGGGVVIPIASKLVVGDVGLTEEAVWELQLTLQGKAASSLRGGALNLFVFEGEHLGELLESKVEKSQAVTEDDVRSVLTIEISNGSLALGGTAEP